MHMYSTLRRAVVVVVAAAALAVGVTPAWGAYGVSSLEVQMSAMGESPGVLVPDTQAGSHPFAVTTNISLNTVGEGEGLRPDGNQRNATIDMPAGFLGNPTAVPMCPRADVGTGKCPADTQVGVVTLKLADPLMEMFFGTATTAGVYNMAPREGEVADLAFQVFAIPIHLQIGVRSEGDYGVRVKLTNVPETLPFNEVHLTLWGVPGAPAHTQERGSSFFCSGEGSERFCGNGGESAGGANGAFLTLPTNCQSPMVSSISTDSWQQASVFATATYTGAKPTGCSKAGFAPSMTVSPDSTTAGAPTGLRISIAQPQEEGPEDTANSPLRDAQITLPEGLAISPAGANGRAACSDEELGIGTTRPVTCPSASRVGTVTIDTPLLSSRLSGGVFIGSPKSGEPYRLFLVAEDPERGVLVRLQASVAANPSTGRLTVTLDEAPQLPVSELTVALEGGSRALLRNPLSCGTATTTAELTPWSAPESPAVGAQSSYQVTGRCASKPFAPSFAAGATAPQAGGSTPFDFTVTRGEGEQQLGGLSIQLPPGVSAMLTSVPRCSAAAALAKQCGAGSQIGTVAVAAGAGSDPLWVQGGQVYLTGPYAGAPFGLSFVVPAVAGPFNLGTVSVMAAVSVDPHTAQVTVKTDPLPQILEGVPLELRAIAVNIDRAGFMVNPTSCEGSTVHAAIGSAGGASEIASAPFNVVNCANLAFAPKLTASTRGKASHRLGASLKVKITQKAGEAGLRKIAVQLPKLLVTRQETLKMACAEQQFAANPAACPAASVVGHAVVHTPILGAALIGPAILVSHAGAGFPDLDLVLKGEGITIEVTGHTEIKKGITHTRIESIPGDPISSIELTLPEGPHAILGAPSAGHSLCKKRLEMLTTMVAQDGARTLERIRIKPQGCRR
jgi:hypothetical protein